MPLHDARRAFEPTIDGRVFGKLVLTVYREARCPRARLQTTPGRVALHLEVVFK